MALDDVAGLIQNDRNVRVRFVEFPTQIFDTELYFPQFLYLHAASLSSLSAAA